MFRLVVLVIVCFFPDLEKIRLHNNPRSVILSRVWFNRTNVLNCIPWSMSPHLSHVSGFSTVCNYFVLRYCKDYTPCFPPPLHPSTVLDSDGPFPTYIYFWDRTCSWYLFPWQRSSTLRTVYDGLLRSSHPLFEGLKWKRR